MKKKNITTEDLARMVKKGFDGTDKKIDKGFKEVNDRLDRIENIMLKQHSKRIETLEKRMHRLEGVLAIK
jgi:polyhydroxyalkanoate synthesis regulator phasin